MSTTATPAPNPVLLGIATQVSKYASLVDPAITAVEDSIAAAPSATKAQTAATIIQTLAHVGEANPNPNIALIAALVDIGVGVANDIGKFVHLKSASTGTAPTSSATVVPITSAAAPAQPSMLEQIFHPNVAKKLWAEHQAAPATT
jgi:hypothetical protein